MNILEDSENAKVSDSAYSLSYSNSHSRRSSKSTHSGSNFSGSSGYGFSSAQSSNKRSKDKEGKKSHEETGVEFSPEDLGQSTSKKVKEDEQADRSETDVELTPSPPIVKDDQIDFLSIQECGNKDHNVGTSKCIGPESALSQIKPSLPVLHPTVFEEGFSCVISMHDGVVMYITPSITALLGFPKSMWLGRSFIDFVHPLDRDTFGTQIISDVALSKEDTNAVPVNSAIQKTMCCRIRKHRGMGSGFGIRNQEVTYLPFKLNFFFKNITEEEANTVFLVIQATPFTSAYKTPNEKVTRPIPFVTRHLVCGKVDYVDLESIPYLGYLPQDVSDKDMISFYHPEDLHTLLQLYEGLKTERALPRSKTYRLLAQNGYYVKVETEFSCFVNPWSRKLEFVRGKHYMIEGPLVPDVLRRPKSDNEVTYTNEQAILRDKILNTLKEDLIGMLQDLNIASRRMGLGMNLDKTKFMFNDQIMPGPVHIPTKSVEAVKQQMSKRCLELALVWETLVHEKPKESEEQRPETQEPDKIYEHDSAMLVGEISPHYMDDSKSSLDTLLSYTQLNYNENLQRYFDRYQPMEKKSESDNFAKPFQISESSPKLAQSSPEAMVCEKSPPSNLDDRIQWLSKWLLNQHNTEMEKDLIRKHRELRHDGSKDVTHNRQKKKDHLARCNAPYKGTPAFEPQSKNAAAADSVVAHYPRKAIRRRERAHRPYGLETQTQGVKRGSWECTMDSSANKHHCHYQPHCDGYSKDESTSAWSRPAAENSFNSGSQPLSVMSPIVSGLIPMHYLPTAAAHSNSQYQTSAVPYVMYPQALFGAPFMYSPVVSQLSPWMETETLHQHTSKLTGGTNCQKEAERIRIPLGEENRDSSINKNGQHSQVNTQLKTSLSPNDKAEETGTTYKTDDESSYSSFSSSFFKSGSGISTEESDSKKTPNKESPSTNLPSIRVVPQQDSNLNSPTFREKKIPQRKDPLWMEEVCMTSDLKYKYQMVTKNVDEVLEVDRKKMNDWEQPNMVNEQLSQLYLDLKLDGKPVRLTLEEGITSSSSSGDDTLAGKLMPTKNYISKSRRKKRQYSRLMMIYEEDCPLPPPDPEPVFNVPLPLSPRAENS